MSSKIQAVHHNLTKLGEVIPLEAPFNIKISIGNTCDFRCVYCGIPKEHIRPKLMSMDEFDIFADRLAEFLKPLKQVSFVSSGETLLNPHLPQMVNIIKQRKVADRVKIITNGSSLNPDYIDRLIAAGLDEIKISLQGISSDAYKKTCGVAINFNQYMKNIAYLYQHKGNCKIHVKIIDSALKEGEEQIFYDLFYDKSDTMFIEHCVMGGQSDNKYLKLPTRNCRTIPCKC